MTRTPATQSAMPASFAVPKAVRSLMASKWRRTAKRKVKTGMELLVANAATVAEVYLRLMLCRFMLTVFLCTCNTPKI